MRHWFHKFAVVTSVQYASMLEYRAEIYFWALSGLLPFVLMGLWSQAAAGGSLAGFEAGQVAAYFTAVFLVRQLTVVWVIWDFELEVVEGRLSPYLLQPMDPVWRHVGAHLGERAARMPLLIVLLTLVGVLYPKALWLPGWRDVLLGLAAITMAFVLRFAIQYTTAMLAFWTERASSIEQLWFLPLMFLSGFIAPLEIYPPAVRQFAMWTPFPYTVSFPVNLLLGRLDTMETFRGFAALAAWTAVFVALNRLLWRRGLREYSGQGA